MLTKIQWNGKLQHDKKIKQQDSCSNKSSFKLSWCNYYVSLLFLYIWILKMMMCNLMYFDEINKFEPLWPIYVPIHFTIIAFLFHEWINFNPSTQKDFFLVFFGFACFRYPRYQRIIGHTPNAWDICCTVDCADL